MYLAGYLLGAVVCVLVAPTIAAMLICYSVDPPIWWLSAFGSLCVAVAAFICIDGFIDNLRD